jgi:predicted  nucleic acid-binding Zn-ribbon protein
MLRWLLGKKKENADPPHTPGPNLKEEIQAIRDQIKEIQAEADKALKTQEEIEKLLGEQTTDEDRSGDKPS